MSHTFTNNWKNILDKLENAFLQDFLKVIESKPDEEKIRDSITQELQKWIANKYSQTTVKK